MSAASVLIPAEVEAAVAATADMPCLVSSDESNGAAGRRFLAVARANCTVGSCALSAETATIAGRA
jgi:hypothetical protein